ncbi:ceramide synthase-like isoform X2 [Nerophis lumbriciformis]|uniref:ceramide synthase-like isoform X2 n=1 Tax=Nerophis lumbriciformis TaxID=546530 RepID=UPI002AE0306F|nr:ceramide synthase-like isoform X2 [Nerophis lumbriciformis]
MLALMAAGSVFFPGIFLVSRLTLRFVMGWSEADATVVSVRGVSSVQAAMASAAGYVIASSCLDVMEDKHWLTDAYISFAAPYFVYDVFAMFLCHRHKRQQQEGVHLATFVRREVLMVLHHAFMVLFCLPASLVWRRGKGDYFQGLLLLAELSTPCVSLAKVLMQPSAEEGAHAAVQGERRADAAGLLRLPGVALPLPVLGLQQVRVPARPSGGAGGPVAVQCGRGHAVAPADLLAHAHV